MFQCKMAAKHLRHCSELNLPQCYECRGLKSEDCPHDGGFAHVQDFFMCNLGCGYELNFDPQKFPDGVAFLSEATPATKHVNVGLTTEPDRDKLNGG